MADGFETYGIQGFQDYVVSLGLPRFRSNQIMEWVYGKGVADYDLMTNLPATLRTQLAEQAPLRLPAITNKQESADGTRKYIFRLHDGELVEAVGIPSRDQGAGGRARRLTVCFSTQVGCAMGCTFCATGQQGFTRNLFPGEIAYQIVAVGKDFDARVSNAVAMGQGEPFLNYDNLVQALHIANHPKALNIGARHLTVSTCGIPDGITRFGAEPEQFTLALSLHAARQQVRDTLMPGMKKISLEQIHQALQDYLALSGRRVSLEYLLIDGVNDGEDDLQALIAFCQGLSAHINLLPINRVEGSSFAPCPFATMQHWQHELSAAHVEASVRDSRGSDIDAACGQLKNAIKK